MKLEKRTVIKHGNTYSEEMRCSFCPECSELNAEFTSKNTVVRGTGLIKHMVATYEYECKNCGCVWNENDIIGRRQLHIDDDTADSLKLALGIFLLFAIIVVLFVVNVGVFIRFIECFF